MPKPLTVYTVHTRHNSGSPIVATTSKAAAAKACNVRIGSSYRTTMDPVEDDPRYVVQSEGYRLAMATPGIPWQRKGGGGCPWRCSDELAGAKAIVQLRFPGGFEWLSDPALTDDRCKLKDLEFGIPLGSGPTESAAWINAARILSIEPPPGLPDGAIVFWRSDDAPPVFRELLPADGDKDWVAWVPESLCNRRIGWLDRDHMIGRFDVIRYPIRGGEVRIGVHYKGTAGG